MAYELLSELEMESMETLVEELMSAACVETKALDDLEYNPNRDKLEMFHEAQTARTNAYRALLAYEQEVAMLHGCRAEFAYQMHVQRAMSPSSEAVRYNASVHPSVDISARNE